MRSELLIILFLIISCSTVYSQDDVRSNVPATPNTAALGKYGSIPVSMNTGLPTILVPLTKVMGKDVSVDIDLSYHAGGIKVEELASWVGLNWSLFAGGTITRQVRSLPDEDMYGFFSKQMLNKDFDDDYSDNAQMGLTGLRDFEPDLFYFSMGNESGKFIYDENNEMFVTLERSRKKISYESGIWKIITENGTQYYFGDREQNSTGTSCQASSVMVTTGWYLSKIVNANKTDSILFEYQPYYFSYQTIFSEEKTFTPYATDNCEVVGNSDLNVSCRRVNEFYAQRLKSITGRSGKVELRVSNTQRLDLSNDYALEYIDVYGPDLNLLYSYKLSQDYFPTNGGTMPENYRLRLNKIDRVNGILTERYRTFEYNNVIMPDRLSYAQDYWGYYNGETGNTSLIPKLVIQADVGPLSFPGANRDVSTNPNHSQMGILKKMYYPTGGYTEFEYESHSVRNAYIPATRDKIIHLTTAAGGSNGVYDTTFTINYGPNELNGFNTTGGAFVSFLIDGINCNYGQNSGQASTGCAVISLSGPKGFTTTESIADYFLPNGTYTLTFDFSSNNDPSSWAEFYGGISWKEIDLEKINNSPTGGLRVRRVRDVDMPGKVVSDRTFSYYLESSTTTSSASLDPYYKPSFQRFVWYRQEEDCTITICITYCRKLKLSATSNYPVTGLNGSVYYSFITVQEYGTDKNGKTTFEYSAEPDPINDEYPFLPINENDWIRGALLKQKEYLSTEQGFKLVKEVINSYGYKNADSIIYSIRVYPRYQGEEIKYLNSLEPTLYNMFSNSHYAVSEYDVRYGYLRLLQAVETRLYDPNNSEIFTQQVAHTTFSNKHHNIVKQELSKSDGTTTITYFTYADDYVNTGTDDASLAIASLKEKNMINTLVEKTTWKKESTTDSILISADLLLYKKEGTNILKKAALRLPLNTPFTPSGISNGSFNYSPAYENDFEFTLYDDIGNVQQGLGKDGIVFSFLRDANKLNVIAVAQNAAFSEVTYNGFEYASSGTSSIALSGRRSYNLPYTVNPGGGSKRLTYWKKPNNQPWVFIEMFVSIPTTIGGDGVLIDEIRMYPVDAQITTYTYESGLGVSSINDANNQITYYDYDTFGRLIKIKDPKGNNLKSFEYHYKTSEP